MPHEEVIIDLPEDEKKCPKCGNELTNVGKEFVRNELVFIPASIKVKSIYRNTYKCLNCQKEGTSTFVKPDVAPSVIPNSPAATPSVIAQVITQKYDMSVPLYRQEREWEKHGLPLSRTTMAKWIVDTAENYLQLVVNRMQEKLLTEPVIHADETPVQVLKEETRGKPKKCYMWVFTTGEYQKECPIRIYSFHNGRSGKHAADFLMASKDICKPMPMPGTTRWKRPYP